MERAEIDDLVDRFFANGGVVEVVELGASGKIEDKKQKRKSKRYRSDAT